MALIKAVVPVAGLGTRLLYAAKSQPKKILPTGHKPIVQYVVEESTAALFHNILFVNVRKKRPNEYHYDYSPEPGDSDQKWNSRNIYHFSMYDRIIRTVLAMQYPVLRNLLVLKAFWLHRLIR